MAEEEQFVVVAIHSFTATAANQLSFQKNELLTVVTRDHSGWWIGRTANGRNGIFPSTYVQRISSEPPPEEAANTMSKERLLRQLPLKVMNPVIRGVSGLPRLESAPGATSVYMDDLFGLEEDDLAQEQEEQQVAVRTLVASGVRSFSSLVAKQNDADSDTQQTTLQQQLVISRRRADALRLELQEARDEKYATLLNMKEDGIPIPDVLNSDNASSKRPVRGGRRQAPVAASAPSEEWLSRADGDVGVARYFERLSTMWRSLDEELNRLEPLIEQQEQHLIAREKDLGSATTPMPDDASPSPSSPKEAKKMTKKIATVSSEIDRLMGELSVLRSEVASATGDAEAGAARFQTLQALCAELRERTVAVEASRTDSATEIRRLQGVIASAREKCEATDHQIGQVREEAAARRQGEFNEYRRLERERRSVYNELQELRGNLRVYCRLRPRLGAPEAFVVPVDDITLRVTDPSMETTADYEFDLVLPEDASQATVFSEVQPLVTSVLDGFNVCVFAYGQTGSGKTHTMEGSAQDRGISFRTLAELFSTGQDRVADGYTTQFNLSVLEVYNDKIYDLLDGRKAAAARWGGKEMGVVVQPQRLAPVESVAQVEELLAKAYENRSVAGTDCNQHSSRSHCLLTIHVASENAAAKARISGKLHLIDLAGSERVKNSGVEGDRLKEATHINKSLTHLKSVIQALARGDDGHVPFRNSALTSLLQDSLGGNCKCLMFANVSVLPNNVPETICTLKYAAEARRVVVGKVTAKVTKA